MGGRLFVPWCARLGRRLALAVASLAAPAALSGEAHAQLTAAPLIPMVTPLKGDDLYANQYGPAPSTAFAPLRLSLTGGLFSHASAFSGCEARADASGNSVNGFAMQRSTFFRLTPHLVLHGFSMLGCPVDAGMGGGLTYSVPLRKSLWLVGSAGFYALPKPGGGSSAFVTSGARVDVVKQLAWGRTLNFGLGTRGDGAQFSALHFGGSF
ncbi:MAG TPA: hypothetical protein VER12_19325 [Polyangiaceae bacterium]|nr:hypothetical protein [Polyangiaceae bacterium]